MKHILVVDIPKAKKGKKYWITYEVTDAKGNFVRTNVEQMRLLPKKLTETETVFGEIHGYRGGWNDCLDEIIGETE